MVEAPDYGTCQKYVDVKLMGSDPIKKWTFEEKIGISWKKILWQSGKIAFIFSISMRGVGCGSAVGRTPDDAVPAASPAPD